MSESPSPAIDSGTLDPVARLIVLIAIVILMAIYGVNLPLTQSLWLDETVSAWLASSDWRDCFRRAATYQAQSPLYFLLFKAAPWREASERPPLPEKKRIVDY